MRILLDLFFTFSKIGLFTFGGGYAMIPLVESICVDDKNWITHDEMMEVTVIAESTPGPIAINCATYVGYKKAGLLGSVIATLGIVLPSFVVIYIVSKFLENFLESKLVANAFKGIKIAVGVLIFQAAIKMMKKMKKQSLSIFILACSFLIVLMVSVFSLKFSTINLMMLAAIFSLVIYRFNEVKKQKGGNQ